MGKKRGERGRERGRGEGGREKRGREGEEKERGEGEKKEGRRGKRGWEREIEREPVQEDYQQRLLQGASLDHHLNNIPE
jgi:hypothetical protein